MIRGVFRLSALALCLLPALALAQPAPTAPTPGPATASAIEQRIAALKSRLGITAAEEPAWESFARTMRDNTASSDSLFAQRTGGAASMTAVENMHSYAAITRAYADNTERLSNAFDALYASLTDAQKRAADALFREQAADAQRPALR